MTAEMVISVAALARTCPWRHQAAALDRIHQLTSQGIQGVLLDAAMGTGKSAIALYQMLLSDAQRVLILCPLRVAQVWESQIERHVARPVSVAILDSGSVAQRRARAQRALDDAAALKRPAIIIMNYDAVWHEPFAGWALEQAWDLLIMDEIHRIKSPGGKSSRYSAQLARRATLRLGLTGTVMPHSPLDVYAQFRALDPTVFGPSYVRFRSRYALMGGFRGHEIIGYRDSEDLAARIASRSYSCSADVLDLPPAQHVTYTCDLSQHERQVYSAIERDLIADTEAGLITAANALVRLLRLQQITGGSATGADGRPVQVGRAKRGLLTDVLTDIPASEPVVVFARFRHDLDSIHAAATDTGRASLEISGRRDELSQWQAGAAPVLAAQIHAGGLGVDLTRARYAIYYSLGYSLGSYEQSLARIHRPGQSRPVVYIHLLAHGTVDEQVMRALAERADAVQYVLDYIRKKEVKV